MKFKVICYAAIFLGSFSIIVLEYLELQKKNSAIEGLRLELDIERSEKIEKGKKTMMMIARNDPLPNSVNQDAQIQEVDNQVVEIESVKVNENGYLLTRDESEYLLRTKYERLRKFSMKYAPFFGELDLSEVQKEYFLDLIVDKYMHAEEVLLKKDFDLEKFRLRSEENIELLKTLLGNDGYEKLETFNIADRRMDLVREGVDAILGDSDRYVSIDTQEVLAQYDPSEAMGIGDLIAQKVRMSPDLESRLLRQNDEALKTLIPDLRNELTDEQIERWLDWTKGKANKEIELLKRMDLALSKEQPSD